MQFLLRRFTVILTVGREFYIWHGWRKFVSASQCAEFPVSAAVLLPIAVRTFDVLLWLLTVAAACSCLGSGLGFDHSLCFSASASETFCPSTVGTDTLLAPLCATDAFCAAEGRSALFGFTDRVAPVPVFFASGLGVFTSGAESLTLAGRTRVCVCQKSLPVR